MSNISSIHICPLKSSAMFHNDRRKEMPHVRGDLTHLNEKWENPLYEGKGIGEIRKDIERRYFDNVHQRMQAKAVPLREGVVNIREGTSLDELRHLAERLQREFGIKTIAIHTHRDEGHEESGEWITNHHAHLILDWTNDQGKSLNLKSPDMARMQTIVAEALNMERGKSSDVKHLDAIQYKNKMQEQQNKQLLETAEQLREEISKLRISRKGKEALLQRLDKFSGLFGKSDVRLQLDASQDEIAHQKEQLDELRQKVENIQQNLERRTRERDKAREEAERFKKERDAYAQKAEESERRAKDAIKEVGSLRRLLYPWRYELPDVVDLSRSKMSRHGGRCWLHVTIEGHNGYVTKPISTREEAMYERGEITKEQLIAKHFTDEIDRACYRRWQGMKGAALEKELQNTAGTIFFQLPQILFPSKLLSAPGGSKDGENFTIRHKSREEIIREMIDEGYNIKLS